MSQAELPDVTVIIPTTCERARWPSLERALASILAQQGVRVTVLAVVNGNRYDPQCFEALKAQAGVTVLYRETGSAPLAQQAGRDAVRTEFFAFLDDDDEYLPGALTTRLAPLLADRSVDFAVSNGYRAVGGSDEIVIQDVASIRASPLSALCAQNWMASCGGLFRSSTVAAEYFAEPAPFMEWTYLAFRLTAQLNVHFVDVPTFRINDSAVSLSKSQAYMRSELDILRRVLELPLPAPVRRAVQCKIGRACHVAAEDCRLQGQGAQAWRYHLKSLGQPGGWRYLLYSRKLIQECARSGF
jgi:glycosyltransferase involved in cell wall biosynthesis